jgi:hypothetical protein
MQTSSMSKIPTYIYKKRIFTQRISVKLVIHSDFQDTSLLESSVDEVGLELVISRLFQAIPNSYLGQWSTTVASFCLKSF